MPAYRIGQCYFLGSVVSTHALLTWFHLARALLVALPAVKNKGRIPPTVDRPAQTPPSDQAQRSAGPCRQLLYGPCQPAAASKFYVHNLPIGAHPVKPFALLLIPSFSLLCCLCLRSLPPSRLSLTSILCERGQAAKLFAGANAFKVYNIRQRPCWPH